MLKSGHSAGSVVGHVSVFVRLQGEPHLSKYAD